ncbi:MAG: adenylate/guanylate cyclase domain-containing protein [Rhodopseudomonas palustris]|uniref:Adenylate/guanylate cyclase domain-containing protein n=1 Tax=Rhodopseudomonas palustris TaxID=1076 RepID=A0A933RVB8_RHOPL|nr:adenylate/guanylate cyclase domain-containing protein [Rhodopseudomonas palustris]
MTDVRPLLAVLRQTTDAPVVDAIAQLIADGADSELNRINLLEFSTRTGLDEEKVISGFLHAAQLGLFDMSWNVLCPGCSGVLDSHPSLKALRHEEYTCALCAKSYEASLDDQVEAAFTVNPTVRRIGAHDPDSLPLWDYTRQMYWSSGIEIDEDVLARLSDQDTLAAVALKPGETAELSLELPADFIIVFEPVTHSAQFIDVAGEAATEPQSLALSFERSHPLTPTLALRPGPLQLTLTNNSDTRVLPAVWVAADALHTLLGKRKPILTAKRMLTNQTFRDVFKADNLTAEQRLKITSLTFLFTDLKGSTALYQRVGDLAAFDLVRAHFRALLEIIAAEKGAVVKTIGDAVMATFNRPEHALAAALRMRKAMDALNAERGTKDLVVKIGIHEGPCLAVMLNERQDYFGQTVNIAARVLGLATTQAIHLTGAVIDAPAVTAILDREAIAPIEKHAALRGIADRVLVYEIP